MTDETFSSKDECKNIHPLLMLPVPEKVEGVNKRILIEVVEDKEVE